MNEKIFLYLNSFANQNQYLDWLIYFCASILPWLLVVGLIFYAAFSKNRKRDSLVVAISLFSAIVAWFLISIFKYNFHSLRPFEVFNIKPLVFTGRGDAMPSGHATFMMALAVSLFLQNKKFGAVFIVAILVIGIARIIAGVHWPMDILVGFIVGFVVSLFSYYLRKRCCFIKKKKIKI